MSPDDTGPQDTQPEMVPPSPTSTPTPSDTIDVIEYLRLTKDERAELHRDMDAMRALAAECDRELARYRGGDPKGAVKLLLPLLKAIPGVPREIAPIVDGVIEVLGNVIDRL